MESFSLVAGLFSWSWSDDGVGVFAGAATRGGGDDENVEGVAASKTPEDFESTRAMAALLLLFVGSGVSSFVEERTDGARRFVPAAGVGEEASDGILNFEPTAVATEKEEGDRAAAPAATEPSRDLSCCCCCWCSCC